ncbi:SPT2 chromatin protein [Arabidopsis thaliana]|uniref:SPT2 chromatin protein n=1 Tax=Arabidopsis thaliana TaxID=3702 RepID=A0A1P8AXS7_ARATH|nr:SPT2 chromatin protein [Arabidopsis thaliana]NP_001323683.1 SPT2 chromatin protein [Arabidopsis thaliana]ANM61464.1 SPT2 chromatin protein [Arabidopsis thaliana]ANM61466.1 SPT2 chromatin protein [Arabidopsis thaliana]|eukprot:NP_001323681.1 SPT2 chromatin protein [Arabidopsis thaliana]
MHGYEDDLDEEAGYDDYYSGDEDEYEDEEEEDEEPPKEELEFLESRQKLKESIRKKMGNGSANAQSSQERRRKLPYNDFGSFFGPSRPVISSRVIQESKSLLENELRKMSNSSQTKKRPVPTNGSGSKNVSQEKRPKVVNEVRRKVETLKDTRDYSFLFSDDAELPVPKKESLSRSGSFPNSEARSAQLSSRPKQSSGINGRTAHSPHREEKRPVSANGHSRPSSSGSQMNHSRPSSSGSKMNHSRPATSGSQMPNSRPASSGSQMQSRAVSGSGRPASSGSQMQNSRPQNSRPASAGSQMQQRPASSGSQRPASSGSQRPGSSTNRQAPMRPPGSGSTMNGQSANRNGQLNSRSDSRRSAPAKVPVDHRKQMSSSNGVGPGRSATNARPLPSKSSLERKPSISAGKSSLQSPQRPSSSRPMSSDPRQRVVEQRKVSRDMATPRMIPKQSAPTSKHQMMSKPALKRPPSRDIDHERRLLKKKKPARSEDQEAFDMLRQLLPPKRFSRYDDDDINMEAGFEDIQKEERRSARIAREEDERELKLLEEEERRERLKKNRKLSR